MDNKTKVLIVDDNQKLLDLINEFLEDEGYSVISCTNGKEAQEKFTGFKPDIVITDIVMPEVDGIELLLALRKIEPDIFVIAISGGNRGYAGSYLMMAEKLGANVILNKPFELTSLLDEIKKFEKIK